MGIIERILNRNGYIKYSSDMRAPAIIRQMAEHNKFSVPSGTLAQTQAELYQRLSWVNIAVSMVARLAAIVQFNVMKWEGEKKVQVENHDFEILLRKPNPLQSRFEFFEGTYSNRKLTGNAYWYLNKSSEQSPPAEMWVLSPHRIKPVPDKNMFIKGYVYDPGDGTEIPLEPWEVIHFKEFHPNNPFVGLSPIEAIATQAIGDMKAVEHNTKFFADGAQMPKILAFADPIEDTQWEQIKNDFKDKGNKRETMFMRNAGPGGVQLIQNGVTQRDMEFLAGREFTKEEIYSLLAPGLASILDVNATEANSKTGEATLMSKAVYPMQVSMAEKITAEILPLYADGLVGEFEDIRERDRELILKEQAEFSKTHTLNEIRLEYYNDEPIKDERGDKLPLELGGNQNQPEETDTINIQKSEKSETPFVKDLCAYKRKALNYFDKKKSLGFTFKSENIDKMQIDRIKTKLLNCKTKEDVTAVFEAEGEQQAPAGMKVLVDELVKLSNAILEAK